MCTFYAEKLALLKEVHTKVNTTIVDNRRNIGARQAKVPQLILFYCKIGSLLEICLQKLHKDRYYRFLTQLKCKVILFFFKLSQNRDKIIRNVKRQYLLLKPWSTSSTSGFLAPVKSIGAPITVDNNLREYTMAKTNSE